MAQSEERDAVAPCPLDVGVTDGVGLLLLFPPARAVARTLVRRRLRVRVYGYGAPGPAAPSPRRYDGPDDVIDV